MATVQSCRLKQGVFSTSPTHTYSTGRKLQSLKAQTENLELWVVKTPPRRSIKTHKNAYLTVDPAWDMRTFTWKYVLMLSPKQNIPKLMWKTAHGITTAGWFLKKYAVNNMNSNTMLTPKYRLTLLRAPCGSSLQPSGQTKNTKSCSKSVTKSRWCVHVAVLIGNDHFPRWELLKFSVYVLDSIYYAL